MAKKAKEETISSKGKFQDALDKLNKTFGKGTILAMDSNIEGEYDLISTGSIGFDYITLGIGGFAKGKMYELMGWEGCLAEDTYIKFINVRKDGIVQDHKGGTIKNLYERFHNRTELTKDTQFNITSINAEDRVFRNEITDVVKSGVKECFELTTKKGFKIKATKDHKFYVGNNYVPLSDLSKGDVVYVHTNNPYRKTTDTKRGKYKETTIKYYYKGKPKFINGSWYFRQRVHRLIFEADQNGLNYEAYKLLLNSGPIPKNFWTIPEGYDVHHIDENTLNNTLSNLQLIKSIDHTGLHALENHNNLRFIVESDKIESIISVGEVMTYDIKCYFPYNNFIAEGIVVHNCGKTTVCGHAVAECQKEGGKVVYIDGEHAVDKTYFQALGVDTAKMFIAQPSTGEEGFQIAMEMVNSGEVDLLIIDSDSSLIPKSVIDGEVGNSSIGKKALLNSNAYPKLKNALVRNKVCVLVISQYREKIGMMFGNPTTTQGGHALKYYADCRVEISKSLAKEGEDVYGNVTKVKATKNKMSAPYRGVQFDIVYGVGIDKVGEIIELLKKYSIAEKYGQSITVDDVKYNLEEFKTLIRDNEEFYDYLKLQVVNKIKSLPIPVEENVKEVVE